jgi:hypothetical protein
MVRDRVRLAVHHHERVPRLAPEERRRERRAALDAVEEAREGILVPAGPGRHLLEVGEREPADQAADVGPECARVDEGAVDRRGERAVEAAHHHAVDRLGRIRRGHGEHGDPPARRREARPERRSPAPAAVHEADAIGPGHALGEVEDAVAARVDAGDE